MKNKEHILWVMEELVKIAQESRQRPSEDQQDVLDQAILILSLEKPTTKERDIDGDNI